MTPRTWAEAASDRLLCKSYKTLDHAYRRQQTDLYCEGMYVPCYYTRGKDVHDEITLRRTIPSCANPPQRKGIPHDVGRFHVPVTAEGTQRLTECQSCDCRSKKHQLFGNMTKRH